MKNISKLLLTLIFLIILIQPIVLFPQNPPDPPNEHGNNANSNPGGGAPVGSGLLILLTMALAYGSTKFYNHTKEEIEE